MNLCRDLRSRNHTGLPSSPTPTPLKSTGVWPPQVLTYALSELRREFAKTPMERIVRMLDLAARSVAPRDGQVQLLRRAREALRHEP
jgi:hypothetical protein